MRYSRFLCLAVVVLLSGCASQQALRYTSKHMAVVEPKTVASYAPTSAQALVIFMRPEVLGYAVQSSVFDVATNENRFVAIVSARTKVAYRTTPGPHVFMVVGESADFMKADLAPGKTYYVRVAPRIGAWKARFSLLPVRGEERAGSTFKRQEAFCRMVENTDRSVIWSREHAASIETKRRAAYPDWSVGRFADQRALRAEDGL